MPDSSPKEAATSGCAKCGGNAGGELGVVIHFAGCEAVRGTGIGAVRLRPAPAVLPGNPGSDWTEQDARDVEHAMRFVEEFFGDKRCSLNAKYATALRREILRLRAELATLDADYKNLVAEVERLPGEMSDSSAEQKARDMLDRMGVPDAQHYSSGDVVELANLIANADAATTSVRSPEVEEAGEDKANG